MLVRQKNPLLKAVQFTEDNAEKMQHDFGGKLLWGSRREGRPQPVLELEVKTRGYVKIDTTFFIKPDFWIILTQQGEIMDVVSNEEFDAEFVKDV